MLRVDGSWSFTMEKLFTYQTPQVFSTVRSGRCEWRLGHHGDKKVLIVVSDQGAYEKRSGQGKIPHCSDAMTCSASSSTSSVASLEHELSVPPLKKKP
jgi:hypothetical protein